MFVKLTTINYFFVGVTSGDWEELGQAALENLELDIARLAFIKLQDYPYLELIEELKEKQRKLNVNRESLIGDVYAHRGKLKEAARYYQKSGDEHKALTMYTDLRMFDLAQEYLGSNDNTSLIRQKADWAKNINEHKAAAEMYLSIGDTQSAVDIYAEKGWVEQLIELGRKLGKSDRTQLMAIAERLKSLKQTSAAAELYRRLGDWSAVLALHVEGKEWAEAYKLLDGHPDYKEMFYIPYAHWLAENDQFVKAQKAFYKAGKPDQAFNVLNQLTANAISECRFLDASYYFWILAKQCLQLAKTSENPEAYLEKFQANQRLAEIYYAYQPVHRYLEEPFTPYVPEALFNISRYLTNETYIQKPDGVSLFYVLYCLAKQAKKLGANKLAKQLLDRIQNLMVPRKFQEQVEIACVSIRAKNFNDSEELLPMCYRCSTYNSLSSMTNYCSNCGQQFVYSYYAFEILPLVEFALEEGISDEEAVRLIEASPKIVESQGDADTLQIMDEDDPFTSRLSNFDGDDIGFKPVTIGRQTLLSLDSSSVFIAKWEVPLRYRYFKNLLPDLQIVMCNFCFKTFHLDDYELQLMQKGYCPFCRSLPEHLNQDDTEEFFN